MAALAFVIAWQMGKLDCPRPKSLPSLSLLAKSPDSVGSAVSDADGSQDMYVPASISGE